MDLTDKLNMKDPKKKLALASLSIYYTWEKIKSEYNNNKSKISASTWNHTFDLPDGFYCRHSRLLWFYHQKTWNIYWKSTSSNSCEQNQKQNYFQNKNGT